MKVLRLRIEDRFSVRLNQAKRFIGLVMTELRRLNHARMDSVALVSLTRAERIKTVKAALAEHHRGPTRCC